MAFRTLLVLVGACGNGKSEGGSEVDGAGDPIDDTGEPSEGTVVASEGEAQAVVRGEAEGDRFGQSLAAVGDLDGDGAEDLLVGAIGANGAGGAFLLAGGLPAEHALAEATAWLSGATNNDRAGWHVAGAGDVDGDGRGDLLVGAPYAQATYLVLSPAPATLELAQADAVVVGSQFVERTGWRVAGGDLDGDGLAEVAMAAPDWDPASVEEVATGAAFVFAGPLTGEHTTLDADLSLLATEEIDLGADLCVVPDLDGDGLDDLVVGAGTDDSAGTDRGAVYILHGLTPGTLDPADADLVTGRDLEERCGLGVAGAGDVDGDELDDLAEGCPHADGEDDYVGRVFVVPGPAVGATPLFELEGAGYKTYLGYELSLGDVDGDGAVDLLAGSSEAESADGRAWLFLGPLTGSASLGDANLEVEGGSMEELGAAAVLADLDGDGRSDILLGAPNAHEGTLRSGALYAWWGADWSR